MKTGDLIEVKTKNECYMGVLMPSLTGAVVVKLDSGYNIGIDKKSIISSKVLKPGKKSAGKGATKKYAHNKALKSVMILHTGGTVASKVSYETGGVISKFSPEELLDMFPELKDIVNINTRLVRNMFSEDMNFNHYNLLAKEVEKEVKKGIDGVIITHGTDTMHYTSCALSFALEDINIPVLLVGAQRSSDRGSSDAGFNLIKACEFISKTDFKGVGTCMHSSSGDDSCDIILGVNARKMHSSRRDAFKSVNKHPIANVNKEIVYYGDYNKEGGKLKLRLFNPKLKVGLVKAYPGMRADILKGFEKYDGLVIEGFGIAGNFPINDIDEYTKENKKIHNALKNLAKKIPVAATSQTIFGRVNMNVYSTGRLMKEMGILGDYLDMTTECSLVKLSWLLSNYPKRVSELISKNIRGEISSRSEFEEEFI